MNQARDPSGTSEFRNAQPGAEAEVLRLRTEIWRLERRIRDLDEQTAAPRIATTGVPPRADERKVRWLIELGRVRSEQIGGNLVAEAAWTILLELFAAELAHRRTSVVELCRLSRVPESTARRWLNVLEEDQWLVRRGSPLQEHEQWAELSARGSVKLHRYFAAVWKTLPPA
jgi:hypothetical protein